MLIRIANFKGQIPRAHPRLIPDNYAQIAKNTRLEDGTIGPLNEPVTVHTFASAPETFIKFDGGFVAFDHPNVDATVGPVAEDRLYFTGDGAPKMRVGGTDYSLGVLAPTIAPGVTAAIPSVGGAPSAAAFTVADPAYTRHQYRYSAIYEGVEIFASAQSEVISRWEGQGVKLTKITVPAEATRFRIYRKDLDKPNQGYGLIVNKPVSALTNKAWTDDFTYDRDVSKKPILASDATIPQGLTDLKADWVADGEAEADFPAVGDAPVVALVKLARADQPKYTYRYSAVVHGVETIASDASDAVIRIDGQSVTLSGLTWPTGTDKIRVYRSDVTDGAGANARFGRILNVTVGTVIGGQITDTFSKKANLSLAPFDEADRAALEETVTYVYTYVTGFGEESAPSPPSDLVTVAKGDIVTVSVTAPVQAGRNITKIRLYRSKTSLAGITDFYFLAELNAVTQTYQDELRKQLAEALASTDFDPPADAMRGLIALPNGMMAAHTGRELLFCEPFKPHAWPVKYRLTTDSQIVGLGAFGSYVAVMTKGSPYIIQGSEPSLLVMEKLEETLPCMSWGGIVDMGYAVAFASYEGLVVLSQNGAQVVTRDLFTEEQWRKMRPESFRAAQLNGRYCFSYQPTVGGARKFGIIDTTGAQPFYIEADIAPTVMHYAPEDGALYYVEGTGAVKQFDPKASATVMRQVWRGKRVILPGHGNFGAYLIETDPVDGTKQTPADPDCVARFYANGVLVHTTTRMNSAGRLPSGFLADRWEIEVEGYAPVTAISLATDIYELAEG